MLPEIEYSFLHYLDAKMSVDDRALNRSTWEALNRALCEKSPAAPLRVLEVGAGTGTMLERMLEWKLLSNAEYTAIDLNPENIARARQRLAAWGGRASPTATGLFLEKDGRRIAVDLEAVDIYEFVQRQAGRRPWDLLVAHAFLDLVDIPATLPRLFSLLGEAGLFYFTINFDGLTAFEPALDPEVDDLILRLYHRTMDDRIVNSAQSGDSQAGRHLFTHLRQAGAQVQQAGASDWVVFPFQGGYPADEAYFLHFIIHTIHTALADHPELAAGRFTDWIAERHAQVERGELVYIAHQIDFFGRYPGTHERPSP